MPKFSPSARDRWSVCPASATVEEQYPFDKGGPSAIDGELTHKLLNMILTGFLPAEMYLDSELDTVKVDRERLDRVTMAVNYISQYNDLLSEEWISYGPFKGRADVIAWDNDTLEIIDYKDGVQSINANDSKQLEVYAWMAHKSHPELFVGKSTLKLTIIQPKSFNPHLAITTRDIQLSEDFDFFDSVLMREVQTAIQNPTNFVAGSHCRWCRHAGKCEKLNKKVDAVVGSTDPTVIANVAPEELNNDRIREIIENAPLVRQYLKIVEEEAIRRIQSGEKIPGFKLVKGLGHSKWIAPPEEMEKKLKKFKIPSKAMWEQNFISPTKLLKITWEDKTGTRQSLSKISKELITDNYITRPESDPRLVPDHEEGEEVVPVSDFFKPIEVAADDPFAGAFDGI